MPAFTSSLMVLIASTTLLCGSLSAATAPSKKEAAVTQPFLSLIVEKELYQQSFSDGVPPKGDPLRPTNIGKWEVNDGVLYGSQTEKSHHPAVCFVRVEDFSGIVAARVRFKLQEAKKLIIIGQGEGKSFSLSLNDKGAKVSQDGTAVADFDKELTLKLDRNEWYTLTMEIRNDILLYYIDPTQLACVQSDDIAAKRWGMSLRCISDDDKPIAYDDVLLVRGKENPAWNNGNKETVQKK